MILEKKVLPFFENRKNGPDFGTKGPNCVHSWVESSIQNLVLRVSRRKSSKIFPCGAFFCVFDEGLSKCPNSTKPPLPWKISGCAPVISVCITYLFFDLFDKLHFWKAPLIVFSFRSEELADAFRSRTDVHFGIYFSLFEWFHPFFLYDQQNKFKTRLYPEVTYIKI